ncbi:MAG: winged helix-turn-helix transcriptional regulator [Anaerolineae bacterium]|nr:winged helix-turn-helix transcriptional regulator [Anaerolineae bacterium]
MMSVPNPDSPGTLFAQIGRMIHHHVRQTLEALGLQRGQPFILAILWSEEGLTQSQLAERVMISPPSISHALQRLTDAGYVERRADPADDRLQRVYLTEAGRALRAPLDKGWRELEHRIQAGLNEEERDTLQRLLKRVRSNLAPGPCSHHPMATPHTKQPLNASHAAPKASNNRELP